MDEDEVLVNAYTLYSYGVVAIRVYFIERCHFPISITQQVAIKCQD